MHEPTITCPHCKSDIKLTESLAAPLVESTRREYEKKFAGQQASLMDRENAIRDQQAELVRAKASIDEQVTEKVRTERALIATEEAKKAKLLLGTELEQKTRDLAELQELLSSRDKKLAEAQNAQAELLRKQRQLDESMREMDLTIEKRIQESLSSVREQAKREAEDDLKLRVAEKEQTIASMQKQIEDLRRKAEQGSQQLQGEVQELELERTLRTKFPGDVFEPVPKGEHGGDALHRVCGPSQRVCGTILWESKRTKNWSDGWLAKLREDQRVAKAELAVIVSHTLPEDVDTFDFIEGVWVTSPRNVVPVAIALRHTLIELSIAHHASEGQQTKMEMVYRYLTGAQFRHRVQAIVEAFSSMQEDLTKERKALTKQWAKREEQIARVMVATVGMYGDLQGIAGKSLQEIEGLELEVLSGPDDNTEEV